MRFKAAVSQRSIADWRDFWYTADFTQYTGMWFKGAPWEQEAMDLLLSDAPVPLAKATALLS